MKKSRILFALLRKDGQAFSWRGALQSDNHLVSPNFFQKPDLGFVVGLVNHKAGQQRSDRKFRFLIAKI